MTYRHIFLGIVGLLALSACSDAKAPNHNQTVEVVAIEAPETTIKHVNALEAQALLASNTNVTVLDIRTPKEIAEGHIEGAIFADYMADDFEAKITKLDRDAAYIVHCRSGGRSTRSLEKFKELGFTNITHLDGGIKGWIKADLPLVTP